MSAHDRNGPILVCGLDLLGIAVVRRLVAQNESVRALASAGEAASYSHELERLGVPVCIGIASSPGELEAAGLTNASAVILTTDDDADNVDAALTARRLRPGVPIVARVFNAALGRYLEDTEERLRVQSMAHLAAPRFVEAARAGLNGPGAGRAVAPRKDRVAAKPKAGAYLDSIVVRLAVVTAPLWSLPSGFLPVRSVSASSTPSTSSSRRSRTPASAIFPYGGRRPGDARDHRPDDRRRRVCSGSCTRW